ncbi:uncharacterized protein BX664DRAFT_295439 [Halteromyces radiatus]|uniref:uncharacterized protein n=1 Tax=Halteromyces radiatus TaxID=101107 RepID=UPI00221F5E26|nr:uncharacterized protein BX664DRAFT_295439 [Halteromyces radiatus]KAI8093591.1 hypothetical protein BX664DRAFT_295439 [Halteromyces radiatus]
MAPIVLKIKGNKSFSPFSHIDSEDELSKTWRVCTKVKDSLENGSRLENLSWRLWFVHNVLNDNTKTPSTFRTLPTSTAMKLDKEKGSLSTIKRSKSSKQQQPLSNLLDTSIPTTFLTQNKLLSTLPAQTLASAERLLLPSSVSKSQMESQQQYQQQTSSTSTSSNSQSLTNNSFSQVNMSAPSTPFPQSNSPQDVSSVMQPPPTKSLPSSRPASPSQEKHHRTGPINSTPSEGKPAICSNCQISSTPLWRRSPDDQLLCNACGLYLKLHKTARPKYLKPHSMKGKDPSAEQDAVQPTCFNCSTQTTPLWRRDDEGRPLCNACGLYLKLHHEKRPLSLKTDFIKKRQRTDNTSTTATPASNNQPIQPQQPVENNFIVSHPSSSYQLSASSSLSSSSSSPSSSSASLTLSFPTSSSVSLPKSSALSASSESLNRLHPL